MIDRLIKSKTVFAFELMSLALDTSVMTTEVDEPDPRADLDFWKMFLDGDCYMLFHGKKRELDELPPTDSFTFMYYMESGKRRATLSISNGLSDEYLICCSEENQLERWAISVDKTSAYEMAEGFVMGRS